MVRKQVKHTVPLFSAILFLLGAALPAAAQEPLLARLEAQVSSASSAAHAKLTRDSDAVDRVASWAAREALAGRMDKAAVRDRLWKENIRDFEFLPLTVVARGIDPEGAIAGVLRDPALPWTRFDRYALASAQGGERIAVCVLLLRRRVEFRPVKQADRLRFTLPADYTAPALFVTRPDGTVARQDAAVRRGAWVVDYDLGLEPGRSLLELMADGPTGPEILALWPEQVEGRGPARPGGAEGSRPDPNAAFPDSGPVSYNPYGDERAPPRIDDAAAAWVRGGRPGPDRAPSPDDARAAEDQLWRFIQGTRAARGLTPLRRDVPMTRAARQHARELASGQPFGHETSSGTALDRLAAEGLTPLRATENVAIAADVAEAHAALLASPSHRANLLDAGVEAGAVGVVLQRDTRGRWSATVSEVFASLLSDEEAAGWEAATLQAINDVRLQQGLEPLRARQRLDEVAVKAARSAIENHLQLSGEERSAIASEVRFHFNGVGNVGVDLLITSDPARAGMLGHALEDFIEVGIGVVRLPEAEGGHPEGTPVIALLFVQR